MDEEQLDYINSVKKLYIHVSILKENPKYYSNEIKIHKDFKKKYLNNPILKKVTNMAIYDLKNKISSDQEKSEYINATKILYYNLNILNGDPEDFQDEVDTYIIYRKFYYVPEEIKKMTDYAISLVNKEIESRKQEQESLSKPNEQQPFDFSLLPSNYTILQQNFLKDKILNYEKQKQIPDISADKKKTIIEYSKNHFIEDTYNYLNSINISKITLIDILNNERYNYNEIAKNNNEIQNLSTSFDSRALNEINKLAILDYLVYILKDRRDNLNNIKLVKMIDSEFNSVVKNNSISALQIEAIKKRVDEKYIIEGYSKIGIY